MYTFCRVKIIHIAMSSIMGNTNLYVILISVLAYYSIFPSSIISGRMESFFIKVNDPAMSTEMCWKGMSQEKIVSKV
jgi:hypothetical protein